MGGRDIAHSHTADTLKTYTDTHRTYLPFCRGLAAFHLRRRAAGFSVSSLGGLADLS